MLMDSNSLSKTLATPQTLPTASSAPPSLIVLIRTWLRIGSLSFGGGSVVQRMIYDTFITKNKWITPEDYARIFAMCELTPGITLFAICILTGYRLRGLPGGLLSLLSFVLPSATITIAMAAVYSSVREWPPVQAALKGIFSAVFGIGLAMDWRIGKPILAQSRQRGLLPFAIYVAILLGSIVAYVALKPPVAFIYIGGALIGALTTWAIAPKAHQH